jgi:hypothetical protein
LRARAKWRAGDRCYFRSRYFRARNGIVIREPIKTRREPAPPFLEPQAALNGTRR